MEKIVILGSGPAGLTAAIYTQRAGLSPLVVEGGSPMGLLAQAARVDNYPGVPVGTSGFELMLAMHNQAEALGVRFEYEEVVSINPLENNEGFSLRLSSGGTLESEAVLLAMGASPKPIEIAGAKELEGRGVSHCAVCDGMFFKGKTVAVVGDGEAALVDAEYLAGVCNKVLVINKHSSFTAPEAAIARVNVLEKVSLLTETLAVEILPEEGKKNVGGIKLRNLKTGGEYVEQVPGVFIAKGGGRSPNSLWLNGLVELDSDGFVVGNESKTSKNGVFVAGDLLSGSIKQAVIAAASGCEAAFAIAKFLKNKV